MNLSKIKLVGFKSFVDPTVLELKSPLVAVVGPNGCGKSNIIDAVRWVMGESSAKNLRGESMSDVIFNGSTTRKPVGLASIELVFDNADGSLGGEYASYAEISIKRQATRDNQSSYFLNGVRCRRRDITDIFLGTGLGPRSYSIIEQGMISRVIEAKPEDLRAFLEEAAGISLYRRRRQETETRMRHTRENLARLDDVREELTKQLDRLKRQSEAAIRYQQLKEEQELLEAEVAALRWFALKEQRENKSQLILKLNTQFEEKMAKKTHNLLELEKCRALHGEKTENYNKIHTQYYEIGTKIAVLEQTLEHHRERSQQLFKDIEQTDQNIDKINLQLKQDEERLADLEFDWEDIHPNYQSAEEKSINSSKIFLEAQEELRHFQENFERFQEEAASQQQVAEVEKARIEQLEKQSREASMHLLRLQQELGTLDWQSLENSLKNLLKEIQEKEAKAYECRTEVETLSETLSELRHNRAQIIQTLDAAKEKRQTSKGRLASLEALQQAALGKTDDAIQDWLSVNGLLDNQRLAEVIEVSPGFEKAVETVLGNSLEALCVDSLEAVTAKLSDFKSGAIVFLENNEHQNNNPQNNKNIQTESNLARKNLAPLLSEKVNAEHPSLLSLKAILSSTYVVSGLEEALSLREQLDSHESVVTNDGIWLSQHWLRVYRDKDAEGSVILREAEMKALRKTVEELQENIETLEEAYQLNQEEENSNEEKRKVLLSQELIDSELIKDLTGKSSALSTRLEHTRTRVVRVQEDIAEYQQRLTLSQEDTALARVSLQSALNAMGDFSSRRELLQNERQKLKLLVTDAEKEANASKEALHVLALKRENLKTQLEGIKQGLERLEDQKIALEERKVELQLTLSESNEPLENLRNNLENLLSERLLVEEQVTHARSLVEEIDQALQDFEKSRGQLEKEAETIRSQLDEARLALQALEIRGQTVQEKLETLGRDVFDVYKNLNPDAEESLWSQRLEEVNQKIQRLGAINLAAIEEYQSESERKNYLDSQHQDLTEALETLENAIRKIDRETRARFKETFDKVNNEFQNLYPKLFGGGHAYLELVGDDLLEAGVGVMARPPGKRNSSIHLLSGGEKALTAAALVFAIFQLNPAPFCMLDEVDAPLDDANVGRFCELVKHMSSTVQFIYITHNKVSMEMAHHLIGVTMKEPGVSRLVSVDVAEAFALAAS